MKRDHRSKHPCSRCSCPLSSCLCCVCPRYSCQCCFCWGCSCLLSSSVGSSACVGGNFPTSVAARKSITAWLHISMENSSVIYTCRHLRAHQPVAIHTVFQTVVSCAFCRLQWPKRCSRACTAHPLHHQHMSSCRCPNRCRYAQLRACPLFSLYNLAASGFTLVIETYLLLLTLPFSL